MVVRNEAERLPDARLSVLKVSSAIGGVRPVVQRAKTRDEHCQLHGSRTGLRPPSSHQPPLEGLAQLPLGCRLEYILLLTLPRPMTDGASRFSHDERWRFQPRAKPIEFKRNDADAPEQPIEFGLASGDNEILDRDIYPPSCAGVNTPARGLEQGVELRRGVPVLTRMNQVPDLDDAVHQQSVLQCVVRRRVRFHCAGRSTA